MTSETINILLTSFPGLGLPRTLSLPTSATTSVSHFTEQLNDRLPPAILSSSSSRRLVLTISANKALDPSSSAPISSLVRDGHGDFVPLRLTTPLCGGKGGFGSQLRAAGGRMSSRRKKNAGESNSSNRNLDGRRLRTVNEAKALTEYLALKPEMEKKEKEARRTRWEQVVELAERREEEIRSGNKGKVDGRWVEDRDEAGERARQAVKAAMLAGTYHDHSHLEAHEGASTRAQSDLESKISKGKNTAQDADGSKDPRGSMKATRSRMYFGFDENDEFMSEDSSSEDS